MNTVSAVPQQGPKPRRLTLGRIGIYAVLIAMALFYLLPFYVMLTTSLKTMPEIRLGQILAWPQDITFAAWKAAWSETCTGIDCSGVSAGFWNSLRISAVSVSFSVLFGAFFGYTLSFWKVRGMTVLFTLLMLGAFIPYQVFLYPMVRAMAALQIYNTFASICLVHIIFGLPITTMLFRNYYATLPQELISAARIDGAGFLRIFRKIVLPMSGPMLIVAVILQLTGIWNDYIIGLVFGGTENRPMTVQLNNIVGSETGERFYNVNMAATILTAAVPMIVYFLSGRWFERGVTAGAVKG